MLTFIQPNKKQDPFNQHNNANDVKQLKKKKRKENSRFWFFRGFSTLTISLSFSWPASSSQVGEINVFATYKWGWSYVIWPTWLVKKIYIYIYIYMRWVQVTSGVTLKSYTFFKPLDLSKSNDQKKTLISTKYLINYPLFIAIHSYL